MTAQNSSRNLISGFLESAECFPDRTALVVDGESLTYSSLHRRVRQIAWAIQQNEQKPYPLAAVWAHRSHTAYIGILGSLGAGKGYVPLNPKFPLERTCRMLALAGCTVLIVGRECLGQLSGLLGSADFPLTLILPEVFDLGEFLPSRPNHRFITAGQLPSG